MLFIDDLSTEYLRHVSFQFSSNTLNVLLGPSGSGKTTLLRYIAGICKDKSRSIRWAGDKVAAVRFIASNMPEELMKLTLREFLSLHGCPDPVAWAQKFKIESRLLDVRQDAGRLSTGELRLISLAIGLLNLPKNSLLLIDELTNGLSGIHIRNVLENICLIQRETESLVICAMHQPSSDTLKFFDNVYVISDRNRMKLTPDEALTFGGHYQDTEANLMALFAAAPLSSSSASSNIDSRPYNLIPITSASPILTESREPLSTDPSATFVVQDLKEVRKKRLSFASAIRLHTILKVRSPGLLTVAFIGALIMAGFNLFINYNNHYVSPVVPANPIRNFTSLNLDFGESDDLNNWSQGFSRFNGDIEHDKMTEEFVKKLSYSFMSSILFGMPVYDRTTAELIDPSVIQPVLAFVSELDSSRLANILSLVNVAYGAVACTADKISTNSTDVTPLYDPYVDVFHPESVNFLKLLHKSMLLVDVFVLDQADVWRQTQKKCLSEEKASLSLYLCFINNLKPILNALTDCLGWPKFPFTVADESSSLWLELGGGDPNAHDLQPQLDDSEQDFDLKLGASTRRRKLSSLPVSASAWEDLKETLTFAKESVSEILARILSPSVANGIGLHAWTKRFERILVALNESALSSCNYTICQLPLLIWPWVISAVRDFLKLVWLDVSNIALLYVLTAVIGCTSLESALSFGDLRQVTSFYHCHSQHFWLRSLADSIVMAVPSFILGAVVSASLRIRVDSIWRTAAISGAVASLGSVSACALTTAIASAVRTKLKALVFSAVALSLLLLLSGFVLKQEHAAIKTLGYLSMFQFTFKGLVKNAYDHAADSQVGVMSNDFTLRFVGGMEPQQLLTVPTMMLVLAAQTVIYRLLGWLIFRSVHKTHSALVEL